MKLASYPTPRFSRVDISTIHRKTPEKRLTSSRDLWKTAGGSSANPLPFQHSSTNYPIEKGCFKMVFQPFPLFRTSYYS